MNDDTDTAFEQWYSAIVSNVTPTIGTTEHFTNVRISDSIQLGTHTFSPQELGGLLNLLLQQHPELRI